MKLLNPYSRRRERGIAVIIVLAILSILLMVIASNLRHLNDLGREMRLIEKKQIHRLEARGNFQTNTIVTANTLSTNTIQNAAGE